MKLLVTGASGLLGHKLVLLALREAHEVYSVYKEHPVSMGNTIKLDLTDENRVSEIISAVKPQVIIHAAAYTDVEGCEINRDLAWKVNAEATKQLAMLSASINAHFIYVSTDYVFDGEKGLYTEEDKPSPINYYGYTKLKGEEFVKKYAKQWCIARASVIYGYGWEQTQKPNFATWIINNLKQGKEIKVIKDQYVSPTLNTNLAEMLLNIAEKKLTGIFHTAGASRISRYEFALKLAETFNLDISLIKPATMDEMSWLAKRPRDSSLDIKKTMTILDKKPLRIDTALRIMKNEKRINQVSMGPS